MPRLTWHEPGVRITVVNIGAPRYGPVKCLSIACPHHHIVVGPKLRPKKDLLVFINKLS